MGTSGRLPAGLFYVQDERYIAIEHMDVRRDWFSLARPKVGWTFMSTGSVLG